MADTIKPSSRVYSQAYGIKYVALRYFDAAGADESGELVEDHDPETHLIPSILEAVNESRSTLEVYGGDHPTPDGTCIRDFVHVNDLAEATYIGSQPPDEGWELRCGQPRFRKGVLGYGGNSDCRTCHGAESADHF